MSTTVYFGPHLQAPSIEPRTQIAIAGPGLRKWLGIIRRSLTNLAPNRQMDESGTLLVVETALCATLLGTVATWLQGSGAAVVTTMLAINGLLVVWLLVGSLIQTIRATRREAFATANKPLPNVWAFRVAKSGSAVAKHTGRIDAQRPLLGPESSGLEREAVLAAELEPGDLVFVDAGQTIAADGLVVDGLAIVDESIVTGQSDLVIRSPEVISAVLRNSRVVAGTLVVRISPRRGHPLDWDQTAIAPAYAGLRKPERAHAGVTADV
jgi:K+-transporting ATPase ATPase B chain